MGSCLKALKTFGYCLFLIQFYIIILYQYWLSAKYRIQRFFKYSQKITNVLSPLEKVDPDVFISTEQLLTAEGYHIVQFDISTVDGYILTIWRIISKINKITKKYPILITHGLLDCGVSWFLHKNKINHCLPYILAEQGYDVWIGNNRGTRYSKKGCQREGYWQFKFDELAKYDVPALIQTVIELTKSQKLIYIGHSQGSTQLIAHLSQNESMADKILIHIGLGTVVTLHSFDTQSMLGWLQKIPILNFMKWCGIKAILSIPAWFVKYIAILTYNTRFYPFAGQWVINMICGFAKKSNLDQSRLGVIFSHEPGGTSINTALQWQQIFQSRIQSSFTGRLMKFDFGKKKNLQLYSSQKPPIYDFSKLKNCEMRTILFRGTVDSVVSQSDFEHLLSQFNPDKVKGFHVDEYHHLDYVWAKDAHSKIYAKILQEINAVTA